MLALFDPKNYPNLFIRGKSVNLWFTTNIRKNHAYNQRTKRLRDTSEDETLYVIEVFGQRLIVTFGEYEEANGRDRPVTLQFKLFPTDRAKNGTFHVYYPPNIVCYSYVLVCTRMYSYVTYMYSYVLV